VEEEPLLGESCRGPCHGENNNHLPWRVRTAWPQQQQQWEAQKPSRWPGHAGGGCEWTTVCLPLDQWLAGPQPRLHLPWCGACELGAGVRETRKKTFHMPSGAIFNNYSQISGAPRWRMKKQLCWQVFYPPHVSDYFSAQTWREYLHCHPHLDRLQRSLSSQHHHTIPSIKNSDSCWAQDQNTFFFTFMKTGWDDDANCRWEHWSRQWVTNLTAFQSGVLH
jgi:hypothetical protein